MLLPSEPDNYYETREIAPPEMLPEIRRAEIVITNYHAFQHRETLALPKVARSFLQGNDPEPLKTTETDARDAGAGLRQAAQLRPRQRHQRRGAPLLSAQGRRRRRGRADRRRQEGGGRERGSRAALDQRHRGAGPQAVEGRARGLRPLGHALLPARFGLSRGLSLPLGRVGFQPDGRDRERHRQAAARAGDRQPRADAIRSSTAISGSISARICRRPPRAPPSSAPSTCPTCSGPG